MEQETADELIGLERHHFLLIVVGVVLPSKLDIAFVHCNQAVVGDGDTMGVTSEVVEHLLWAGERRLRIHNPLLLPHGCKIPLKSIATLQRGEGGEELQPTRVKRLFQQFQESTAIEARSAAVRQVAGRRWPG